MLYRQPAPFLANSAVMQDIPDTLIDQLGDAGVPGKIRWESIFWQIQELNGLGSVRWQVLASVDNVNWTDLVGGVDNPTEGEINPPDLGPNDRTTFILTNTNSEDLMAFRYYKMQVSTPSGDSNRWGKVQVFIYAR